MKRIGLLFILLLVPLVANAASGFLGVKKASEFIVTPDLSTLDSAGFEVSPDSFTIVTYADNGSSSAYSLSQTTIPGGPIDTTKLFGGTQYYFVDQIQDIDGAGGNFQLAITISGWKYGKATKNSFTVQVVADSINTYFADIANIDGWNPITDNDSLIVDQSSLEDITVATVTTLTNTVTLAAGQFTKIGDTGWAIGTRTITGDTYTPDVNIVSATAGALDSAAFADSTFALDLFSTNYWTGNIGINWGDINNKTDVVGLTQTTVDAVTAVGTLTTNNDKTGYSLAAAQWEEVWRNIDTTNVDTSIIGTWLSTGISASLSDANMGAIGDSVWDKSYADAGAVAGSIGDSLATAAYVQGSASGLTAAEIMDSLKNLTPADTVTSSYLATLLAYSDTALQMTITNFLDSLAARTDTGDIAHVNVVAIWDDTTAAKSLKQAWDQSTATGPRLTISQFRAVGNNASEPTFAVTNTSGTYAAAEFYGYGDANAVQMQSQGSGAGLYLRTETDTAYAGFAPDTTSAGSRGSALVVDGGYQGHGAYIRGGALSGYGLTVTAGELDSVLIDGVYYKYPAAWGAVNFASNNGIGWQIEGGMGGVRIAGQESSSSYGLMLTAGVDTVYWKDDTAWYDLADSIVHCGAGGCDSVVLDGGDALYILAPNQDTTVAARITGGIRVRSDYGPASDLQTSDGAASRMVTTASNENAVYIEGAGTGYGIYSGPSGTKVNWTADLIGSGSGLYSVLVHVIDTSGTDDTLSGVDVTVQNSTGTIIALGGTNASGNVSFNLNAGTWTMLAAEAGYTFPSVDHIIAANDTVTVQGYNKSVSTPSGSSTCTVYGYVYNLRGDPVRGAEVTFSLTEPVNDTCNNTIMSGFSETAPKTDSTGYFEVELIYSSCLGEMDYRAQVKFSRGATRTKTFTVPDAATYELIW